MGSIVFPLWLTAMMIPSRPVLLGSPNNGQTRVPRDAISDEMPAVDHPPSFLDGGMSAADLHRDYVDAVLAERHALRIEGGALSDGWMTHCRSLMVACRWLISTGIMLIQCLQRGRLRGLKVTH